MSMNYAVIRKQDWDHESLVQNHAEAEIVALASLPACVQAISGRGVVLSYPSVSRRLRDKGRVYVAPAPGHDGVIVEKVVT